eukprot:2058056-Amphidinium_carterae.1
MLLCTLACHRESLACPSASFSPGLASPDLGSSQKLWFRGKPGRGCSMVHNTSTVGSSPVVALLMFICCLCKKSDVLDALGEDQTFVADSWPLQKGLGA